MVTIDGQLFNPVASTCQVLFEEIALYPFFPVWAKRLYLGLSMGEHHEPFVSQQQVKNEDTLFKVLLQDGIMCWSPAFKRDCDIHYERWMPLESIFYSQGFLQ